MCGANLLAETPNFLIEMVAEFSVKRINRLKEKNRKVDSEIRMLV